MTATLLKPGQRMAPKGNGNDHHFAGERVLPELNYAFDVHGPVAGIEAADAEARAAADLQEQFVKTGEELASTKSALATTEAKLQEQQRSSADILAENAKLKAELEKALAKVKPAAKAEP